MSEKDLDTKTRVQKGRCQKSHDNFDNLHKADHDLMLRLRNTFYLYINSK